MLRRENPKDDVTEAVEHVATPRKEGVELLAPDHWALRAMMDDATKAIYDDVLDLLTFEQRTPGEVLKRALVELKERLMVMKRRKIRSAAKPKDREPTAAQPQTEQPLTASPATELLPTESPALIHDELVGPQGATRHVSAEIARIVFERDDNQCQFVGDSGRKCGWKRDLHLHHLIAWARGGATTPDNLKVYCACHNLYQGGLDFGPRRAA